MAQPTRVCPTCHTPLPGNAAFCYVCGAATPSGIDRATGQRIAMGGDSGITSDDLLKRLQRALGPGYQIEDRIGAGGFAVVYKARDLRLKRDLAVKVLRPDLGLSADILQRFRREAETIAALRHSNIVPIYDVGESDGVAFLIMPMIHGESLRAAMEREGAMAVEEVRRILREAAAALAAAHDAGMIHRDVKPENIMLEGKDRRALLMDFGIAKAVSKEDGDPGEALTTTGIIIGTPQYMSPEQATGDKRIDARTDQYSLAVVGYRMLSGRLPFEGESTRAVLYQQLVAEPAPLETHIAGIPSAITATIQRAMAKEPNERFDTMREFASSLAGEFVTGQPKVAAKAAKKAAPAKAGTHKAAAAAGAGFLSTTRGKVIAGVGATAVLVAVAFSVGGGSSADPASTVTPIDSTALLAAGTTTTGIGSNGTTVTTTPPPPPPPVIPPPPPAANAAKPNRGTTATNGSRGAAQKNETTTQTPPPVTTGASNAAAATCVKLVGAGDWAKAATTCATEGDGGNAASARHLAGMYAKGTGVAEDQSQAANWYRKASAAGDAESKFRLAEMLEAGRGVKANVNEANAMLRESAALSYLPAQTSLALRLETGKNIKKDEAEAAVWYRRAADRGDKQSQFKLGEFLAKGRGVTRSEVEAMTWYKKASDNGVPDAAWAVSQMYFKGATGIPKNETEGMFWLRKAAEGQHAEAVKELKKRGG